MIGKVKMQASVTVFLVLIFTLIFSMVLVSLEAAKSAAERATSQLLLNAAVESEMGTYYRPLFDEYHLFAMNIGYGSRKADIGVLEANLRKRIQQNSDGSEVESLSVYDAVPFLSDQGELFINQAVKYEEFALTGNLLSELLERIGILGGRAEAEKVLLKKTEAEEQLARLDAYTLQLMKLIDGVNIDPEQILKSGRIYSIENSFVKKMFVKPVNMINTGINNETVFSQLKSLYVNPLTHIELIRAFNERYQGTVMHENTARGQLEELNILISELERKIADSYSEESVQKENREGAEDEEGEPGTETEREQIAEAQTETDEDLLKLKELSEEAEELQHKIDLFAQTAAEQLRQLCGTAESLYALCRDTVQRSEEVLSVIAEADELRSELAPIVEGYEVLLTVKKEVFDTDEYSDLFEELNTMKNYVGLGKENIGDYSEIKETLKGNLDLLRGSDFPLISQLYGGLTSGEINTCVEQITGLGDRFKDISYGGLYFDYSSITGQTIGEKEGDRLRASVTEALSTGVLNLLLFGEEGISNEVLETDLLPDFTEKSEETVLPDGKTDYSVDTAPDTGAEGASTISDIFSDSEITTGSGGFEAVSDNSLLSAIGQSLSEGVDAVGSKAMTAAYIHDNFSSFSDKNRKSGSVLQYEQEYILCGGDSDKANLAGAATRILMLRLIISFIYSLTDKGMNNEAKAAAEVMVGFSGIPFLIIAVKYLILMVWSFEQASVETAAVLKGKKVPIITGAASFCIGFSEILSFTPEAVKLKAESFREGQLYLTYEEYLLVFLMLQGKENQARRTLGIIQENIRYKYDEDFLLTNCIAGFCANAKISFNAGYLNRSLYSFYDSRVEGYGFSCEAGAVYR